MAPADKTSVPDIGVRDISVRDDPKAGRFEARVAGTLVGYVHYRVHNRANWGPVVLTHTEVEPAWEGKGIGSTLARGVLDQVRSTGRRVVPKCPFIADYIRKHREYVDLVDPGSLHLVEPGN